jgi:Dullard-like phosphatase family protein
VIDLDLKDLNHNLDGNINKIISFIDDAKHLTEKRMQMGLDALCSDLQNLTIDLSLTNLLDSFFEYFTKKGIVTVEYINNESDNSESYLNKNEKTLLSSFKKIQSLVNFEKTQKTATEIPFIKSPSLKEYTLILDLDETLVHYKHMKSGGQLKLRPYLYEFLHKMSLCYEVVIFTASVKNYADQIINLFDKDNHITHRLYREHTIFEENVFFKDISLIGRNLDKVIIIDNLEKNFKNHDENGIWVKSWYDDEQDSVLLDLIPFLRDITQKKSEDVRQDLKIIKKLFKNGELSKS